MLSPSLSLLRPGVRKETTFYVHGRREVELEIGSQRPIWATSSLVPGLWQGLSSGVDGAVKVLVV